MNENIEVVPTPGDTPSKRATKNPRARYYVNTRMLRQKHACFFQTSKFRDTFGTSAMVTRENVEKALDAGLQMDWLAYWLKCAPKVGARLRDEADRIETNMIRLQRAHRDGDASTKDGAVSEILRLLNQVGDLWQQHKAALKAPKPAR